MDHLEQDRSLADKRKEIVRRERSFWRRALRPLMLVALMGVSGGVVHLFHVANRTRLLCNDFVARNSRLSRTPVPPCSQAFTFVLNNHPTAGKWPGIKPGWVFTYRNPGPGSGIVFYVDLTGDVVHTEPLGWK